MGKVIAIGGSPMTGKTAAAVAVAAKLGYKCGSTDDLYLALQTLMPVRPQRGKDYKAYLAQTPLNELIDDARSAHTALAPALERLIGAHSGRGESLVIEGWALYPGHVHPLCGGHTAGIWLVAADGYLREQLDARKGFLTGRAAQNFLLRSLWHNETIRAECMRLKIPYITVESGESTGALVEKILAQVPWV